MTTLSAGEGKVAAVGARDAERMRLFCEVYIEAFRRSGNRYTEGSYARTALEEFDKAFPSPPRTPTNEVQISGAAHE